MFALCVSEAKEVRLALRNWSLAVTVVAMQNACLDYSIGDEDSSAVEPVVVEETFIQAAAPMLDTLWVIDNTGSMEEEQEALADSFASFVDALDGEDIDYQLGVVTTDIQRAGAGELVGSPWIITPQADDPVADFVQAVEVGTDGTGPEAGFGAAYLALTEPNRSGSNRGFRRDGATLHVVVVSDTDDESDELLGDDTVSTFAGFLEEESLNTGSQVLFSALAGETPNGCSGEGGRAQPAERYETMVEYFGGVFSSICTSDMSAVVSAIGVFSIVYPSEFPLQASAVESTIKVELNDQRQNDGWSYEASPPTIVFDTAPAPDSIVTVRYEVSETQEAQ